MIIQGSIDGPPEERLISSATMADVRFVHYSVGKNVEHSVIRDELYSCEVISIRDVQFTDTRVAFTLLAHVRAKIESE
jgi:hypothetical protein